MLDVGRPKLPKGEKKTKFMNVALEPQTYEDFATACRLRGLSMSGYLRPFIIQLIREEKERELEAFTPKKKGGK